MYRWRTEDASICLAWPLGVEVTPSPGDEVRGDEVAAAKRLITRQPRLRLGVGLGSRIAMKVVSVLHETYVALPDG